MSLPASSGAHCPQQRGHTLGLYVASIFPRLNRRQASPVTSSREHHGFLRPVPHPWGRVLLSFSLVAGE